MDAAGKVAVVAGGGSGMGRASAELLAKRGAKVAVLDLPGGNPMLNGQTIRLDGGQRFAPR
jgi:NAD(P)-dependent dehydrogenase (short-subunit alcohol dehydrogenase family)